MVLAKALLPNMIAKREGAVINIGSVSGKTGEANGAAYSASKFGLIGFTQSLYEEVREHGIKVAVILPGFVDTPLIPPNRQLDRSKMIQADDIAQTVLFVLTSPATCCPVEITVRPQRTPYQITNGNTQAQSFSSKDRSTSSRLLTTALASCNSSARVGIAYRQAFHSRPAGAADSLLRILNHKAIGRIDGMAILSLSIQTRESFEKDLRFGFPVIYVFGAYDNREMLQ